MAILRPDHTKDVGGASARRCGFVDGEIAARRAKSAVAQRAAKRALNPSTMVGWESTASRSVVAGISAIITACTVPIISPASASRMVHPRMLCVDFLIVGV